MGLHGVSAGSRSARNHGTLTVFLDRRVEGVEYDVPMQFEVQEFGKLMTNNRRVAGLYRHTWVALIAAMLLLPGCEDDPVGPQPQSIEIRITGGVEFYTGGTASFGATVVELQPGIVDLRGSADPGVAGTETVVLDLEKGTPVVEGQQTTQRFDRFETELTLAPGIVDIDLGTLPQPVPMVELDSPVLTAFIVDDPCTLQTHIVTESSVVDADRAIYFGSFGNLIAFTVAESLSYDGGDLFDDGMDRSAFHAACATDVWDLADTVVCAGTGTGFACVQYAWGEESG